MSYYKNDIVKFEYISKDQYYAHTRSTHVEYGEILHTEGYYYLINNSYRVVRKVHGRCIVQILESVKFDKHLDKLNDL